MNSQEFVPTAAPKPTAMFQPLPKMNAKPFVPSLVPTINESSLNLAE